MYMYYFFQKTYIITSRRVKKHIKYRNTICVLLLIIQINCKEIDGYKNQLNIIT